MRRIADATVRGLAATLAALAAGAAAAYPEGAPWGAADPDAAESCSSCHFDDEPRRNSDALSIEGLPETAVQGREYELLVRLTDDSAAVSGFQLIATAPGGPAGDFRSEDDDVETIGAASRSIRPAAGGRYVNWTLTWRAAAAPGRPVVMYLAASSANDDRSPFGDTIHYRSFVVDVEGETATEK